MATERHIVRPMGVSDKAFRLAIRYTKLKLYQTLHVVFLEDVCDEEQPLVALCGVKPSVKTWNDKHGWRELDSFLRDYNDFPEERERFCKNCLNHPNYPLLVLGEI